MAIDLFGYSIGKKVETPPSIQSFAPPTNDDAAVAVTEGGFFGTSIDMEQSTKTETVLITKYRDMSQQPECQRAVDDVINEAIISDEDGSPVEIVLDDVNQPDEVKDRIREEYEGILKLLQFNTKAYDIFSKWYVDGRLYYHLMIDTKKTKEGIQEIRYIDPRRIKKVRAEKRQKEAPLNSKNIFNKKYNEYFIYSPKGVRAGNEGVKIASDSIAYVHSGILNGDNSAVLGHLHKAIKPLNQLRMLEDATVIYRIARAPERRIFYIDVGNLPKGKAEQYLRDMMAKHKNKLVYDANTGEVKDDRKFMTMLEDYWLPRREGGRGTEITTLPSGQNLGELDDVLYFRKKLYESLNVPSTRLESESQFNMGRANEITRDELKFSKFIKRLRTRFSELFSIILEKQLLLKGVITKAEWVEMKDSINYDFMEDNYFAELKEGEVLRERLSLLRDVDEYTGKYFSTEWIRTSVLKQSEDDVKEIDKQIESEKTEMGDEDDDNF
jgi:hypothetical protein